MIARWHLNAAIGTVKAFIPFQETLRRAKRRLVPYRTDQTVDQGLLTDGLQMIGELRSTGLDIKRSVVLEVGSGWHPVIPLLFHLAGARRIKMTDQVSLMDASLVASAASFIERNRTRLTACQIEVPAEWLLSIKGNSQPLKPMLAGLGMDYDASFEFSKLGDESIDVLVSRAVLEHIRPDILTTLFAEFRRVLKPGGYMCHVIDNTDHYAHTDKSINYVNFLRFEDWQWRLLTINPFAYTNRLRHSDYRQLIVAAGFRIVRATTRVDKPSLASLRSMRLAGKFRNKDLEDLATATSLFVSTPASSDRDSQ